MPDAEWKAQFEKLMLELAQVSAEIRKKVVSDRRITEITEIPSHHLRF